MESEAEVLELGENVVADVVGGLLGDGLGEVVLQIAEETSQGTGEEHRSREDEECGELALFNGAVEGLVDGGAREPGHGEAGGYGEGHGGVRAYDEGLVAQAVPDESEEDFHVWVVNSC